MKLHLVLFNTFSNYGRDGYYDESIERLKTSFLANGGDEIHHYDEITIPLTTEEREYFDKYKDKAFGFYAFKPIVILDVFSKIDNGDVVLYHDAGRPEYRYEFKKDLRLLANIVKENYQGLGLSHGGWSHNELTRDFCFKEMGCDTPYIRSKPQLAASWGFYEKNFKVRTFVKDWKKWCLNYEVAKTEEPGEINHKEFKAHRWDQSILTNLFYLYSFKMLPNFNGWEKDINSFIHDYSAVKVCKTFNNTYGVTLIVDVFYKDNKLVVLTSGAVEKVLLFNDLEPTKIIKDSHRNFHQFEFETPFSPIVKLRLEGIDEEIDNRYLLFKIIEEKQNLAGNSIITGIFHNRINSLKNVKLFINYHLNLGVDTIILHENSGENYQEMLPAFKKYIDSGRLILKCLKNLSFYQKFRTQSPGPTNAGEVSHMNLSNCMYKEAKCIIPINVDEFLILPDNEAEFNPILDTLIQKYYSEDLGCFKIFPLDFDRVTNGDPFYKSTTVIGSVNNGPKTIVFPKVGETITCHDITNGKRCQDLGNEELYFNHYPFIDNSRVLPPVKYHLEKPNIDETLFNEPY